MAGVIKLGQMAEACAVTPQTIRKWVKVGALPKPMRSPTGRILGWPRSRVADFLLEVRGGQDDEVSE